MSTAAARDSLNGLIMRAYVDVNKARDRATAIGEPGMEEDLFQIAIELQRLSSSLYTRQTGRLRGGSQLMLRSTWQGRRAGVDRTAG